MQMYIFIINKSLRRIMNYFSVLNQNSLCMKNLQKFKKYFKFVEIFDDSLIQNMIRQNNQIEIIRKQLNIISTKRHRNSIFQKQKFEN